LRKTGNINFVLIGAKATGKTVYLASLFLNEKSITSKDGRTIDYLKPLSDILLDGSYPQATAGTLHELKFNYKNSDISCQIQIDDVDGYFVETMHKGDETTQKQRDILMHNIKNSEGIIFFFPYEEEFNEVSIKNFNYEIDTIISELTKMYSIYDYIPIPACIVISKWDKSPYFKMDNENEKALEFINSNKFLRLAKEKIDHYFHNLKIIPISATGNNIEQMEPYNIKKPLNFFISATYNLWVIKIDRLRSDKKALLKYLSRLYFDMKFYNDGFYNKMYHELEKEFWSELILKFEAIDNYKVFLELKKKNIEVIPYLSKGNIDILNEMETKLKTKQIVEKVSFSTIVIVLMSIIAIGTIGWYTQTKLLKSENELYSNILIEEKNNNYKDTMSHILDYQKKFKDTSDYKHKSSIEKIKSNILNKYKFKLRQIEEYTSLIKQYHEMQTLYSNCENANISEVEHKYDVINNLYDSYQKIISFSIDDISEIGSISILLKKLSVYQFDEIVILKNKFNKSLVLMANNIISNKELDNVDSIDGILKAFSTLGIDNADMIKKLMQKKSNVQNILKYRELIDNINKSGFKTAISIIETDWSENYDENKERMVRTILDRKFNKIVEKILKTIPSSIGDIDNFNTLKNKLQKINSLQENTKISNISYIAKLTNDIENILIEKNKFYKKYNDAIKYGISIGKITFGAYYKDNEPLGFKCGGEDEIVLSIDSVVYSYKNNKGHCHDINKMTWSSYQNLQQGVKYKVIVKEVDIYEDDKLSFSIELSSNNLIKIVNKEYFDLPVGNGTYFIGFGEK